ncbi:transferase activity protein [[Candida] boidinii]|nr:transferase activity protein [[Candida] boidinii]OWB59662.1 transferase activity protein [[Candida] boidinii]OWB71509.1 transferase activity protein [[Candida] boidinii]OWB76509.1 transferase activity protein [[Candida] boidinii]
MVASTQPLANAAGLKILEKGGNCVDASVAVSAVLSVVEPASTGIGGDCFLLFYNEKDKKVRGLNGCGRSASKISVDYLEKNAPGDITENTRLRKESIFTVNVPGAIDAWIEAINTWGSGNVTLKEILQPAIDLSEFGAPISFVSSLLWKQSEKRLVSKNSSNKSDLAKILPNGNHEDGEYLAPNEGDVYVNKELAKVLKLVAENGRDGFYKGEVAHDIVSEIQSRGGLLSLEDLEDNKPTIVTPISMEIMDKKLWEIPPNGSGIIALLTLGMLKVLDKKNEINLKNLKHNSTEYLHLLIELLKISFKLSDLLVNDPSIYFKNEETHLDYLNSNFLNDEEFLYDLAKNYKKDSILNNNKLLNDYIHLDHDDLGKDSEIPNPMFKSDTVYHNCTDKDGNACSFINSVYFSFGSAIIIPDRGFTINNRGGNFNCNRKSKNCIGPSKRSYHTIIPGMITSSDSSLEGEPVDQLYSTYGIMGGYNQPQAHVQVFLNMVLFGMNPQQALDAPRFSMESHPDFTKTDYKLGSDGPASTHKTFVNIESVSPEVIEKLKTLGHNIETLTGSRRFSVCGRGQIIKKLNSDEDGHLLFAGGSDFRGDGAAVPQI